VLDFEVYFCRDAISAISGGDVVDRCEMPSMDGGRVGGSECSASLMTMSFHDLERPSAVVDSVASVLPQLNAGGPGSVSTDNNGNNLSSLSYAELKGTATVCALTGQFSRNLITCI